MSAFTDELERLVIKQVRQDMEHFPEYDDVRDAARRKLEDMAEKLFKLLTEEN